MKTSSDLRKPRYALGVEPSKREVDDLISRAEKHPLGLDYLKHGALESVSSTFETHAFVVDDARARLIRP